MAIETRFTAITGLLTISTANSNLDGTGTLGLLLTAGSNGTLLKSIIVKAQTSTRQGVVRFYIKNASDGNINLLYELTIPIITKSGRDCSFQEVLPLAYSMLSGDSIYVSTQVGDTFNIIAEGLSWTYPGSPTVDFTQYTANSGGQKISVANPNLDGTGTSVKIFTAGLNASGFKGCEIISILVKGLVTTNPGMVRLFIAKADGSSKTLFSEIVVDAITQDTVNPSYAQQIIMQGSFALQSDYTIYATTELGERFSVIIEGFDWLY